MPKVDDAPSSLGDRLPELGSRGQGWVVIQLALIAGIFLAGLLGGPAWSEAALGISLVAGGILIAVGGWLTMQGVFDLEGPRTAMPRPPEHGRLAQRGVYGRIRHPIYAGMALLGLGWALATASPLAIVLAVAFAIFLDLKSRREEAWLAERYPEYAAYRARTRRFMPGVY